MLPGVIKLLTKGLSKDVKKYEVGSFSVQFKEMIAVCAGLGGYIVAPCDNTQKAYSSHLQNSTSEGER